MIICNERKKLMENLKYYCNHHPNVVSLMLYGMNVLLMYLMSLWIVHTPAIYQSQTNMYLLQAFQVTVVLFLAFVLAKLDGKPLFHIKGNKKGIMSSTLIGLCILILIYFCSGLQNKLTISYITQHMGTLFLLMCYQLYCVAFFEEIIMRACIGTRFHIGNKWISMILVGVLFMLAHVPSQMVLQQVGFLEYISSMSMKLLNVVLLHIGFQLFYHRFSSVSGPVLVHFALDFFAILSHMLYQSGIR